MSKEDAHEIVEELRTHITEKATVNGELTAAAVDAALASLWDPVELAGQYVTDALLHYYSVISMPSEAARTFG